MHEFCKNADKVCNKIAQGQIIQKRFPKICSLCCIAFPIFLATVWPERGFSTLCREGKTKLRNNL